MIVFLLIDENMTRSRIISKHDAMIKVANCVYTKQSIEEIAEIFGSKTSEYVGKVFVLEREFCDLESFDTSVLTIVEITTP